jgi:hypothetical protein
MVWFSGGRITKLSPLFERTYLMRKKRTVANIQVPKPMAWANFPTMISPPWLDLLSGVKMVIINMLKYLESIAI